MPAINAVIQLVLSLSKTERRNFRLFTRSEGKERAYLRLYDLIIRSELRDIELQCRKEFQGSEFNTTVNYLYNVVIKSLIALNQQSGPDEKLITGIQEVKLLFRKGLTDEGFEKIEKLLKIAAEFEKFEYCIVLGKLKLHYLNRNQFGEITEDELLKIQNRLKKNIQFELNLSEHASLYELLNYRFVMHGITRSAKDKEKLNDLVFAEMNLAGNPRFQSFNLKKNHLLFQSVYFMMTGDNKSSLSTFFELNNLFEGNRNLWLDSPIYYIQHLKGILNNLHITGQYANMQFFIEKLDDLQKSETIDVLRQAIFLSRIKMLLGLNDIAAARILIDDQFDPVSKMNMHPADRAETYLYTALVNYHEKNLKNAARLLRSIIHLDYLPDRQTARILKLINLVVHFELSDFKYLVSGIRSLERELQASKKNYLTEKVILRVMKLYPGILSRNARKKLFEKAYEELSALKNTAYESQLFYVFDFERWIESKINR